MLPYCIMLLFSRQLTKFYPGPSANSLLSGKNNLQGLQCFKIRGRRYVKMYRNTNVPLVCKSLKQPCCFPGLHDCHLNHLAISEKDTFGHNTTDYYGWLLLFLLLSASKYFVVFESKTRHESNNLRAIPFDLLHDLAPLTCTKVGYICLDCLSARLLHLALKKLKLK